MPLPPNNAEWNTYTFRFHMWWMGMFGRTLHCGCKGYCRGHLWYLKEFKIKIGDSGDVDLDTEFLSKQ